MKESISNIVLINNVCGAIVIVAAVAILIATIVQLSPRENGTVYAVFCGFCLLLISLSFLAASSLTNNELNNLTNTVNQQYNIELSRTINSSDIDKLSKTNVSGELIATVNSDKRVYTVYLVEKDGEIGLYTRNEKGVYLPITSMAELEMNKA